MDIFDFAIEKEHLAQKYYMELAEKSPSQGLAHIFKMLAAEEAGHIEVVEKMKRQGTINLAESEVLTNARDVFVKMRDSAEHFDFDISQVELYKKACSIERQSRRFYLEKASETKNTAHKDIFNTLAGQELKHLRLMEGIVEFVSRPMTWLENAEFYHLDEY